MIFLGDFPAGATVEFKWNAFSGLGGSITRATNGSIRIYKGHSDTQRSSSNGITDTEDFDGLTGVNHLQIDTSDNTDAGFYAAGNEYQVVLQGAVIDGQTVNTVLAHFSIERGGGLAAIKAKTDNLPSDPADASVIASATDAILTAVGDVPTNAELATALAAADDAVLAAVSAVSDKLPAALVNGRIAADIGSIAGEEVTGDGSSGDKWRPA